MTRIQHVFKRGSVYWWRRRFQVGTGARDWVRIELSLHTKEIDQAKTIALEVTRSSQYLFISLKHKMISVLDAKRILYDVVLHHSDQLDLMKATGIGGREGIVARRANEISTGWTLRLLSSQGKSAAVGDQEISDMRAAGLDDAMIVEVSESLSILLETNFATPLPQLFQRPALGPQRARSHVSMRQLAGCHPRSAEAPSNFQQRSSRSLQNDIVLLRSDLMGEDCVQPSTNGMSPLKLAGVRAPSVQSSSFAEGAPNKEAPANSIRPLSSEKVEPLPLHGTDDLGNLIDIITRVRADRVRSGEWQVKYGNQHLALAKLFVRFVQEHDPRDMRQSQIAAFKRILYKMPKNYGRSPKDHVASIDTLLKRAEGLPAEQRGFSNSTINQHMTQISNIVDICKYEGYPFAHYEGVSGLRVKKAAISHTERGKFSTEEIEKLLALPVWNGSRGENDRLTEGTVVIHDATCWAPLLGAFSGARREEICALLLSEVELDADLPCLRLEPNFRRQLKNFRSRRRVPLHAELLQLGFREYVQALRGQGHTFLFPELQPASQATPMGDVFDVGWQKLRAAALQMPNKNAKVFHSLRHWCNNEMKQAGVASEIRKDILGYTNGDLNEGWYAETSRLHLMADALNKLPVPTAKIIAHPVRVLKQVSSHTPRSSRNRRV